MDNVTVKHVLANVSWKQETCEQETCEQETCEQGGRSTRKGSRSKNWRSNMTEWNGVNMIEPGQATVDRIMDTNVG